MKKKTISGHYGQSVNLAHNNRNFIPNNVDLIRVAGNYYCIAGQAADIDPDQPRDLREFWSRYRELSDTYWSDRSIRQTLAYKKYREQQEYMRRYYRAFYDIPWNPVSAFLVLLMLPLLVPCGIYLNRRHELAQAEFKAMQHDQMISELVFKASRVSLRKALYEHDFSAGTTYLRTMDSVVREMSQYADDYLHVNATSDITPVQEYRYATLEEIYEKLYEPFFRSSSKNSGHVDGTTEPIWNKSGRIRHGSPVRNSSRPTQRIDPQQKQLRLCLPSETWIIPVM